MMGYLLYRYTPAELRCLPINTVLDKPQPQSISSVVISSISTCYTTAIIDIKSTNVTTTVASNRLDINQRSITAIDTTKVLCNVCTSVCFNIFVL